jgi:ParB/RepB/Spo0J family partition protein
MEESHILRLKVTDLVSSPFQGRLFDLTDELTPEEEASIDELKESIENNGLLQPIVVRPNEEGKYEIIDGHRRVIAYRKLGIGQIKAIVKDYSDKEAQVFSIVGNLQREDLSAIEQAISCKKVLNSGVFNDQRELSRAIGKDETYVSDLLNMLKMDQRVIDDLTETKSINDVRIMRMIRRAAPLDEKGKSSDQWQLYNIVKKQNLNRKQVAELIKERQQKDKETEESKPRVNMNLKKRVADIKVDMSGLPDKKKERIKKLLDDRLVTLEEEIKKMLEE